MDRTEKVAYYCSELDRKRSMENQSIGNSNNYNNTNTFNNNNNNNSTSNNFNKINPDTNPAQKQQHEELVHQHQHQSSNSVPDYPSNNNNNNNNKLVNRLQSIQVDSQRINNNNNNEIPAQQSQRQFVSNQVLTAQSKIQHQQGPSSSSSSASSTSQPQYLISNSNPNQSTNLTPRHFNQHQNNNPFPNQNHPSSYHINSNHHLYQANFQQQQQQQPQSQSQQLQHQLQTQHLASTQQQQQQTQNRQTIFQNHISPSASDDGGQHPIKLQNQVIFHDNNNKIQQQQFNIRDQDPNKRSHLSHHNNINDQQQFNLTSSQSMTQSEFDRVSRKDHQQGLTSEVGLESLNLEFEAMLMNDPNQSVISNQDHILQQQKQKSQQIPNSGPNIDKLLQSLVNQQSNRDNVCNVANQLSSANGEMSTAIGVSGRTHMLPDGTTTITTTNNHVNKQDSPYMVYNRSEDNIYEEIDIRTINRLQAEYPVDTISLHSDTWKKNKNTKKFLGASFTRWFSTRKKSSNSQNSDQEDNPYIDSKSIKRPRLISLPDTIPENLTPEKLKRRFIVSSIVDSENSYTNSLYRLIYEYKKPLEESEPPILSANKIGIIFFCLDQILQFHKLFGLALSHHVQEWDEKEMIGSVFTTSFSKPLVLDIYSGFINNFTNAMETARRASKSKAFAQFLHEKSLASPDRLSFFGSMVKPVQRFPQFILLLSDLLKHTPFNHPDRIPLQRALTELESLADRLNERKRDAERHFAVKQLLKDHLNESNAHSQRYLLRQDDTCILDIDPSTNSILKTKTRKMYLLNDMLICVSTPSNRLKFAVSLSEVTIMENIPAITNLLAQASFQNPGDNGGLPSPQSFTLERMECERQSLIHDHELMMRIAAMVASLRFQYNGLNPMVPEQICLGIRDEIRKKEFQMTLIDRSCLQLKLNSKNNKYSFVVQFSNPDSKRDWLIDVRLTRLALDRSNNPGWENVADGPPPANQVSLCTVGQRVPLFVKSLPIFKSDQSHLTCALHYYLRQAPYIGENPQGVLWICNVSSGASSLGALATNGPEISLIHSYELSDSHVTCLESVGSTLWIGLRQGRIIVIDANSPSEWVQFASLDVQNQVICIKYFGHFVYVGLTSGVVAVFDAINFDKPFLIQLSQAPVTCLLPINEEMFACSSNRVWRIKETNIVDSFTVQNDIVPLEEDPRPNLLAHCGSGIWISLVDSPVVKLYHAETLKHLVDINVGTSIRRVLNDFKGEMKIIVTSMMTTRGLLWIGTNVGMIATINLPRLQGVPLMSGSVNVALHRFLEPVNILVNLTTGSECVPRIPSNNLPHSQQLKLNAHSIKNEDAEAIYGQYADLMNVADYITNGRKSGGPLGEGQVERMGWEYPNVNISTLNVSDDSASNASSGAIYQDGIPRGMKQVQNKTIVQNVSNMAPPPQMGPPNQQQQAQQQQHQIMSSSGSSQQEPNHAYDKSQQQQAGSSINYNTGSLGQISQNPSGADMLTDQQQQQQQQQQPQQQQSSQRPNQIALSTSQTHLASSSGGKMDTVRSGNHSSDYISSHSGGKTPTKLYDQPTQLIQQQRQQQIHQSRQALNQLDASMLANNMQQMPNGGISLNNGGGNGGGYSSLPGGGVPNNNNNNTTHNLSTNKLKGAFVGNKTVLVLAGGNGYQRMALGDNKPFGEHAHCIIWEYKA